MARLLTVSPAPAASHKNGTTVGIRARMKARAGKKQTSGSNVHAEDGLQGEAPSGAQRLGYERQRPRILIHVC